MINRRNQRGGKTVGWVVTLLIAVTAIGAAAYFRDANQGERAQSSLKTDDTDRVPETKPGLLPRTARLAQQKENSLVVYNQPMPMEELLLFYREHTGREVSAEAFQTLSDHVVGEVIPKLWRASEEIDGSQSMVLHRSMSEAIQKHFPHRTLTNADVVMFPDSSELRLVVSEPATDFFRDTAWHWRWIGNYIAKLPANEQANHLELDNYAAEEFSEFLSVLGVALVEMAAEKIEDKAGIVDADSIRQVIRQVANHQPNAIAPLRTDVVFSQSTKDQLLSSLPNPMFREVPPRESGIHFVHQPNPENQERREVLAIPLGLEGGGVSAGDFDADGHVDLYFGGDSGGVLYRNKGDKSFEDVTASAGLTISGETRAGYFIDFDNDGDMDFFATRVNLPNLLFANDGSGLYSDVTEAAGIKSGNETTHEAVWFDHNNDGLLDVYVANFGDWYNGAVPTIGRLNDNAPPNRLYRQNTDHTFVDVTEAMQVGDRGWTHCVAAFDYDRDGWADLFSLNDFGASLVYRNLRGQGFSEVSKQLKLDDIYNAMSFNALDLNHNGDLSIYISQIIKLTHRQRYRRPTEETHVTFDPTKKENIRILVNNRLLTRAFDNRYRDDHDDLIEPAHLGWAWDVSGLDYENDADVDLIVLNGTETAIPTRAEETDIKRKRGRNYLYMFNYEQNVCFVQQDGYFYDVSGINPIAFYGNSRGSTFLDYDQDGDLDVAVSNYSSQPKFFENLQNSDNHWIRFKLIGGKSNRDAVGATVEIQFGDQKRFDQVVSRSGFLSQKPHVLHFGLGSADRVDRAEIVWPSGTRQQLDRLEVDAVNEIREPE